MIENLNSRRQVAEWQGSYASEYRRIIGLGLGDIDRAQAFLLRKAGINAQFTQPNKITTRSEYDAAISNLYTARDQYRSHLVDQYKIDKTNAGEMGVINAAQSILDIRKVFTTTDPDSLYAYRSTPRAMSPESARESSDSGVVASNTQQKTSRKSSGRSSGSGGNQARVIASIGGLGTIKQD